MKKMKQNNFFAFYLYIFFPMLFHFFTTVFISVGIRFSTIETKTRNTYYKEAFEDQSTTVWI